MMEQIPHVIARDLAEVEDILKSVTRRDECVKCDDSSKLTCPACGPGESCQFTVPLNCMQCAKSFCTKDTSATLSSGGDKGSSGPSAGPIAGGVVGGIIAIAVITYLIWRFVIKPKRAAAPQSVYETDSTLGRHVEKDDASRMTRRSSTHTVHSIASTVLTRASNIIQIAYIPGVTNRATPASPSVLVPPVPPIPMRHSQASRSSVQTGDPHFFMPGSLRDSTFSGISGFSDRTSYAPRSSIASTIYGRQAQIQTPAQTGMRAKPTVVSVKPAAAGAPSTPPVPSIDFDKLGVGIRRPESTASDLGVSSPCVNNANTATQGRAQVVKLGGSGLKKVEIAPRSDASASSTSLVSSSDKSSSQDTQSASNASSSTTEQGPFSDPPQRKNTTIISTPTLGPVVEEAEEGRGAERSNRPGSADRGRSPFGDEHATKE